MDLFEEGGGHTREREPAPHTVSRGVPEEPWRSTVTTTVDRQSAQTLRAITLTALVMENLNFFRQNALLSPGELKVADRAVADLQRFLNRNRQAFTDRAKRNAKLVTAEFNTTRTELASSLAALRKAGDLAESAALIGRVNLLDLRRQRLRQMRDDAARAVKFFARLDRRQADG